MPGALPPLPAGNARRALLRLSGNRRPRAEARRAKRQRRAGVAERGPRGDRRGGEPVREHAHVLAEVRQGEEDHAPARRAEIRCVSALACVLSLTAGPPNSRGFLPAGAAARHRRVQGGAGGARGRPGAAAGRAGRAGGAGGRAGRRRADGGGAG
jgi:hypothetical protein